MTWCDLIVNWNSGMFGFGASAYFHRHNRCCPLHFHLLLEFVAWFVELRVGRDHHKEAD